MTATEPTQDEITEGQRRAAQIKAAQWRVCQFTGEFVYAKNPFGDGNDFRVLDLRGWGHLTGRGALAMDPAAAEITQLEIACHIANLHNQRR